MTIVMWVLENYCKKEFKDFKIKQKLKFFIFSPNHKKNYL